MTNRVIPGVAVERLKISRRKANTEKLNMRANCVIICVTAPVFFRRNTPNTTLPNNKTVT